MGTPGVKMKIKDVERALRNANGVLTQAAAILKCERATLYDWLQREPYLVQVREEASEILLDVAESNVHRGIHEGSETYTRYFLDRKGRSRGYSPRAELSGPGGEPLPFELIRRADPGELEPPPQQIEHTPDEGD